MTIPTIDIPVECIASPLADCPYIRVTAVPRTGDFIRISGVEYQVARVVFIEDGEGIALPSIELSAPVIPDTTRHA